MQSAAAIGLLRPCAARWLLNPSPRRCGRPLLPPARGLRISAAAPRAGLAAARGRIGLVPASPEQDDQSGRGSRHVAAAAAAGKEEAGGEAGGGLAKTLQLGALFGLWYLFNIYFNTYNKQ